jgi:hypothetical protein
MKCYGPNLTFTGDSLHSQTLQGTKETLTKEDKVGVAPSYEE